MSTSGTWNSSYICTFSTIKTLLIAENKFFSKLAFSLLADTELTQIQRRLIDLSKTENSALPLMYICQVSYTLLVCSFDHKHKLKGKECGSILSSRLCGGALRYDTKDGYVGTKVASVTTLKTAV